MVMKSELRHQIKTTHSTTEDEVQLLKRIATGANMFCTVLRWSIKIYKQSTHETILVDYESGLSQTYFSAWELVSLRRPRSLMCSPMQQSREHYDIYYSFSVVQPNNQPFYVNKKKKLGLKWLLQKHWNV